MLTIYRKIETAINKKFVLLDVIFFLFITNWKQTPIQAIKEPTIPNFIVDLYRLKV